MSAELLNYQNNRLIRSFGRIKSRKLSDHKNFLLSELLPKYEFAATPQAAVNKGANVLEIGFGFGDFLFEKAKKNPQKNFYGFEPHLNGVVNLLAKLEQEPLLNICLSKQDVRGFWPNFPDKFFDEIFILFPDPWPKSKHFKRRLLSLEFLDSILAPKMKDGGKLVIATDHDSYKTWILAQILRSKNFFWEANSKENWQNFPSDWVETKYQRKAIIEGRVPVIFNLSKNV